jgi:hypothetical protein
MSYTIIKTDGTQLTTILDSTTDQVHSSLTLIGKNASSYGAAYNENLVYLLENFSNTLPPRAPITGQLWFDKSQSRLKVYDGINWKVSGGTIVAGTPPSGYSAGDIWIDNVNGQLNFNDGSGNILAAPIYTKTQGKSGFDTTTILDTSGNPQTIVFLYVGQILLGIFSNANFTPASSIAGFSGSIVAGFNVSSLSNIKFTAPVSQADALLAADGTLKTAESFVKTDDSSATAGTLTITNSTPLILGANANSQFNIDVSTFQILNNTPGQNFQVTTKIGSTLYPSIFVDTLDQRVGIYNSTPAATLDVNGDVIIGGNLTVNGSVETISSTTVTIADKNIVLGQTASPTDTTAGNGGITLKGATDKFINWATTASSNATTNTGHWNFSDNINISTHPASGSYGYYLNNQLVIGYDGTSYALGSITSAPNLTSVGALGSTYVANLYINSSSISYYNNSNTDGTITLVPKGNGTVDVSGKRITTLSLPTNSTDAASKQYVDNQVQGAAVAVSLTTTLNDAQIASTYLSKIFPASEHKEGTICRVVCTNSGTTTIRQYVLTSGTWIFTSVL